MRHLLLLAVSLLTILVLTIAPWPTFQQALTAFITPVPGGVGPVTVSMLMQNTVKTFKAQTVDRKEEVKKEV